MRCSVLATLVLLSSIFTPLVSIEYTQKDRDLLIEIRTKIHEIDKRFEQIDKRFEQIDKRFDFQQNVLIIMLAALIGSPFLIEYLARRREAADKQALDEARRAVIALRELAQKDPKVANALRVAGLL